MTKAEVLKMAAGIVKSLIKLRTPDFSELEKAHRDLGEIVTLTKGLDPGEVPQDVATGIKDVIDRMESFRSGYAYNDPTQQNSVNKSFTLAEFGEFVKTEVEAANKETVAAVALKRLHVLDRQITKASEPGAAVPGLNKALSVEDTTTITVPVFVDAGQIVPTASTSPVAAAQSGAPSGDSNFQSAPGGSPAAVVSTPASGSILSQGTGNPTAGNYEAAKGATSGSDPAAALASAAAAVEAASVTKANGEFEGWPMDMSAPRRKSSISFGRDSQRS